LFSILVLKGVMPVFSNILPILFKLLDTFPAPTEPEGPAGPAKPAEPAPPAPAVLLLKNNAKGEDELAARILLKKAAGSAAGSRQAHEASPAREAGFARPEGGSPPSTGLLSGLQDTALLLPLPLKSPHFREAGFYLVLGNRDKSDAEEKEGFTLLLVLKTTNLGVLRLFFLHQRENLQLSWLTQTDAVKEYLEKGFPELEAELSGAGYANVIMNIRRLPEETQTDSAPAHPRRITQDRGFDLYV